MFFDALIERLDGELLKILFLGGDFNNTGGTERVSSLVANELSEAGYSVVLASLSCGNKPFFPLNKEIMITSLYPSPGRTLLRAPGLIYRIRRLLKEEEIDILIVVESMSVLFTLPAVVGLPVKHICWEHFNFNNDLGRKGRALARQLAARFCDSVVTLTEKDKQYWLARTKHKNQIISIPNPCPFPVQSNTYPKNSKVVLAVGRLVNIKGYDLLLRSWLKVIETAPDWQLKIVGEGEDRANLNCFIDENNLSSSVELVGNRADVKSYYEQAALFCLSSRFEGFPMVLLEALSFGLPVVSFDCDTGPAEILSDTGSILVKSYDTDLLANGLIKLINDVSLRESISVASKEKVKQYQSKEIIKIWKSFLEEL